MWEGDVDFLTMWFNFLSIDSEVERKYQNSSAPLKGAVKVLKPEKKKKYATFKMEVPLSH